MYDPCDVRNLNNEYQHLALVDDKDITEALVSDHDWTEEGATEVIRLATDKGSFLLRNALALAIALKIEDGNQGL